jgi:hypothetical protein
MIEFTGPADIADNPQKIQPEGVFLTAETLSFVRWRRHHNSKITARITARNMENSQMMDFIRLHCW